MTQRLTRAGALLASAGAIVLAGCEVDSYMDPSVLGRWEHTPASVPVLDRIDVIEDPAEEFAEYSEPSADDLIPEIADYRIGPGDVLDLTVYDIPVQNQPSLWQRAVDARGYIEIPQLGEIFVAGSTAEEAKRSIEDAAKEKDLVRDPLVSVVVSSRRELTYNIIGAVSAPGPYFIPAPDYRLLQALSGAGGVDDSLPYIYIIRTIPLSLEMRRGVTPPGGTPEPAGDDLIKIIDDLSKPPAGSGSPSVIRPTQPVAQPADPPSRDPVVNLDQSTAPSGGGSWLYLDGRWVRVGQDSGSGAGVDPRRQLVTQRIIRVPTKRLLSGDATLNIVVRPGDLIRIPFATQGEVYVAGQVNRPGVFNLPRSGGRLTIERAIIAAGGLSPTAIPSRVDLTRVIGPNRQATVRLDLRAIAERTHPDVYLKPDDIINIGTNFWAYPLAVVRNGLRASYGFGFLLDRNFGNDVFGPPPVNRIGQ